MDKLYSSLNNLKTQLPQFWHQEPKTSQKNLTHLATPQILEIGNVLNAIVENVSWEENALESLKRIKLDTPRVVVVGTQSSGKSSVLNGILSLDVLPVGKNMVTRTPLHLQLIQTEKDMSVEFGNYDDSSWKIEKRFILTSPEPTMMEIEGIREEIDKQTVMRAGKGMGISAKEIIIKFYSPFVPNLSLIDLPGLTMVACTDKGQPKDIKDQIRHLVSKYIQPEKSLILAVMSARTDLETDMALDLIKEFDPRGMRTIGVLTKVDLMNSETDVADYLYNNVSVDLQLKYGYYAVRNRSSSEMMTLTHKQGLDKENQYFSQHSAYSNLDETHKRRLGIVNLGQSLSQVLIEHIRKSLPELLSNLRELQSQMDKVVKDLGVSIPEDDDARASYLHTIINSFITQYISSLEERGAVINIGRKIKECFNNFRKEIAEVNPFSQNANNQEYYTNVIKNCEGNHMSLFSLPIEVLEYCLKDTEKRPLTQLYVPAINCLQSVSTELRQLIDSVAEHQHLNRFPKLISKLRDIVTFAIINPSEEDTQDKLKYLIDTEEGYIWTHNPEFNNDLKNILSIKNTSETELLRQIVEKYYIIIRQILEHNIPKFIMLFLVRRIEKELYPMLFQNSYELLNVLQENPEEEEKRIKYKKCLKALQLANQIFEKI
jgi:GTP-binding protein EngB required for normal cell division